MPHTQLLTHLHQLAADHALAEQLGTTPAEVRAARASRRAVSRRGFLGAAVAGAAGLALVAAPRTVSAAPPEKPAPTIAIVGGGIAGLTAAMTLADAGYASTMYEASPRLGGRMHSNTTYWNDGQVSEWAGELIDSGHKTIRALAKRFNLILDDLPGAEPVGSGETHYFDGAYYEDLDRDYRAVHNAIKADVNAASYPTTWDTSTAAGRALDNMSIAQWIDSRVPGGRASAFGQLLDVAYNIEYGAETSDQSALNLLYLLGYGAQPGNVQLFGASDERYHIRGGNEQLPAAIAASLPAGSVKTGWRLTAVSRMQDGRVSLRFATSNGNQTVVVDRAILTLPFAVLRTLDVSGAGFDARKQRAIRELGRGRNGKLQLQFNTRLWNAQDSNGASYSDTGYQATWEVSRGQAGQRGILVDYTGGDVTGALGQRRRSIVFAEASTNGVSAEAQTFLGQAEPVFPGLTAQWNGKATLSIQHHSPLTLCSYSYWRVGQYQDFGGYEGVPQGAVHFAGEHTSVDFQGYMEGGAETGVRAAGEIIAAYKR